MSALQEWGSLNPALSPSTLATIKRFKFSTMTPVQSSTIPLFLSHKDVVVQAVTGSGKTLAFLVPIMELLIHKKEPLKQNDVGALIVTPTRELAEQIAQVLQEFLKDSPLALTHQLLIGGTDLDVDTRKFMENGAHIIVGTPGRVEAFMTSMEYQASFKQLEVLVLDEADRLLDLGFYATLSFIFQKIPRQRRTGLFSATQTKAITDLARVGMRNPVLVDLKITTKGTGEQQVIPSSLSNVYMMVDLEKKLSQLIHFLKEHEQHKIICYFLTCNVVDYIYKAIVSCDFLDRGHVFSIHGHVPQEKRKAIYQNFVKLRTGVLLTTDLASRGLDIADVDWIVQYDPPQQPDAFVHRIGRTARMGKMGNAIVFLTPEESEYIEFLTVKKVPITEKAAPEDVPDVTETIKKAALADRDLFQRSQTAMVSYVRGYKEHHCAYIFDLKKLDLVKLAKNFALLRLPVMPEIKKKRGLTELYQGLSYEEIEKIPFKDAKAEKVRLGKLDKDRDERMRKAQAKRDELKKKRVEKALKKQEDKRLKKNSKDRFWDEFEELARETREYKKAKRGLISQEQYDDSVGNTELMGIVDEAENDYEGEGEEAENGVTHDDKKEEKTVDQATQDGEGKKKKKKKKKKKTKPAAAQ